MKNNDRFKNWVKPVVEDGVMTKYNWVVQNVNGFQLGDKTDIGAFTYINALHGVVLEDGVQVGSHCSLYSISTIDNKQGTIIFKKNSCLGSHSTVMPGVTVGENSIIGAHSFVNSDIPANCIAVGVPAKIIENIPTKLL